MNNQLMKFTAAQPKATEQNNAHPQQDPVGPEVVEQLRHRLIKDAYCDSVEVKVAIVGELVYQCYKQLAKKRYL
jgi:hypothetical protein